MSTKKQQLHSLYITCKKNSVILSSVILSQFFVLSYFVFSYFVFSYFVFSYFVFSYFVVGLDYTHVETRFDVHKLQNRRKISDVILLYKIVSSRIDCPELLQMINFNIPLRRPRLPHLFSIKRHRTVKGDNDIVSRLF